MSRHDADSQQFVYVCEPVHNLVHRSLLTRNGVSFTTSRAPGEREQEFLTSTDNWFRPVTVRYGPDRAIWIADMYRQVIEHPEWIPMTWQKRLDHLGGHDKGRIYRIVFPTQTRDQQDRWRELENQTTIDLVEQLDSPNGVLRDMIQQELFERHSVAAIAPLKDLVPRAEWAAARVPIFYLLHDLGALDEATVGQGFEHHWMNAPLLKAAWPVVVSSAAMHDLLFGWLETNPPGPADSVMLAYLLGELDDPRATHWLAKLAVAGSTDHYRRAAVMSSVTLDRVGPFSERTFTRRGLPAKPDPSLWKDLVALIVGSKSQAASSSIIHLVTGYESPGERFALLADLIRELHEQQVPATTILTPQDLDILRHSARQAITIALDESRSIPQRLGAIEVFGFDPQRSREELASLRRLLEPQVPAALQTASIKKLQQLGGAEQASEVLGRWTSLTPELRRVAIHEALQNLEWTRRLVALMEQGQVSIREIDLSSQAKLREHQDASIRAKAEQLLRAIPSNRQGVVDAMVAHASTPSQEPLGKQMFTKHCAACHQLEGQGRAVGPDLTALSDKSRLALLTAILDPNRAVEDKYLSYTVVLESGQTKTGMLVEETATSLSIADANGETSQVLRSQVDIVHATGKSLMPEGLELVMTAAEVDAVVQYVRSVRARRKTFPGNTPQIAPVRDDGSLRLFGMHAEIYGPHLVFEPKYRNLGYWQTAQDRATWRVQAKRKGRYRVSLDYACPPEHAGDRFQVRVNGQTITGQVGSTGSWDNYHSQGVGSVELPTEPVEITVVSEGPINGYLFDLRTVIFWPAE